MVYDFIIVGAGIAGASIAYFLQKEGAKVLVLEQNEIGSGGSHAAGAFISPRLGKGGPLQKITNEAFRFSVEFYEKEGLFYKTGILRLPKDEEDAKKFEIYKDYLDIDYRFLSSNEIDGLSNYAKKYGGIFFENGGIVDAKKVCFSLLKDIEVKKYCVKNIKKDVLFYIDNFKSKSVVLATGAWDELLKNGYFKIGKVGGVRFDVKSSLDLCCSVHKKISISKKIDEKIIIGATHKRLNDINESYCKMDDSLLNEAKKMANFKDLEVLQMYCGVRSSVDDHLPIIGEMIDLKKAILLFKNRRKKPLKEELIRIKNLYLINGFGGRGFVFGPFIANMLKDFILKNRKIDERVDMDRYFYRYLKRLK